MSATFQVALHQRGATTQQRPCAGGIAHEGAEGHAECGELVGHVPADRAGGPDENDHSGSVIVGARSPLA